jgi:UDP-N-acetylmuramate--alanine ligase
VELKKYTYIYFLGIGGIGMSALARWFKYNGFWVGGYDKTATSLTDDLINEGIEIHFDDSVGNIPDFIKDSKEQTLVIYTPAIPKEHEEYTFLLQNGFEIQKRSQVLGLISSSMRTVAVAGTHGKTTTSSMIAHILKFAGMDCAAFLGGIANNFDSNLLVNSELNTQTVVVVEADEYDRSFLTLNPEIAIITSTDPDHLDIYGDKDSVTQSFRDFAFKIKEGGKLFIKDGVSSHIADGIMQKVAVSTYALHGGQIQARKVGIKDGSFYFDAFVKGVIIKDIELNVPGYHNVENALAAISVALELGINTETVKAAVKSFTGVRRRFDYIIRNENFVYVDDYAHHPAEVEAFLSSFKALYKDKKLTAIFQPHLYSRTRDFASEFAQSLSIADEVILLDIYPAREKPIEGVSSDLIFHKITAPSKISCTRENLMDILKSKKNDIKALVTMGAGDIDQFINKIKIEFTSDVA